MEKIELPTRMFLVEIVLDTRLPKEDQVLDAQGRLMIVSGVKSVEFYC